MLHTLLLLGRQHLWRLAVLLLLSMPRSIWLLLWRWHVAGLAVQLRLLLLLLLMLQVGGAHLVRQGYVLLLLALLPLLLLVLLVVGEGGPAPLNARLQGRVLQGRGPASSSACLHSLRTASMDTNQVGPSLAFSVIAVVTGRASCILRGCRCNGALAISYKKVDTGGA